MFTPAEWARGVDGFVRAGQAREQRARATAVTVIDRTECGSDGGFLESNFASASRSGKAKAEKCLDLAGDDSGSDEHAEYGGVDRVTDRAIRAGLDRDGSAPIGREVASRPNGEGERCGLEREADVGDGGRSRGEAWQERAHRQSEEAVRG